MHCGAASIFLDSTSLHGVPKLKGEYLQAFFKMRLSLPLINFYHKHLAMF